MARAGVASRRACEPLIAAGRVTVNGRVVTEMGFKVDSSRDVVCFDGEPLRLADESVTLMLNKPAGVVCAMAAQDARPIVADLVPVQNFPGLFPVGRLDADATGLLLFTTDGDLGNALLHPSRHVPKTYRATLDAPLGKDGATALETGVELDDGPAQPAQVAMTNEPRVVRITVHEGRYHQVKRMFEAVGRTVRALERESFGPLRLRGLKPGKWRVLDEAESQALRDATKAR